MKILVTGFEPFGGIEANPSSLAVGLLPERVMEAEIIKQNLPVVFGKAADLLIAAIKKHSPDAVICMGLAGGRKGITPELIAVNLRHARIPDNAGFQPEWEKICPEGEDGLFSTLPIREMTKAMNDAGISAEISKTAGTYVCNEVMYRLLSFCKKERPGVMAGFIHLPYAAECLPEGKDAFAMPLAKIRQALEISIYEIMEKASDKNGVTGKIESGIMGLFDFLKKPDINEGVRVFRETKGAVLLDVRTDEEYKTSHIPESISIPLDRIMTAPNVLKDKNAPVFSYCLRGSRSRRAVSALRQMGYTNVINIGGIDAYRGEITRG